MSSPQMMMMFGFFCISLTFCAMRALSVFLRTMSVTKLCRCDASLRLAAGGLGLGARRAWPGRRLKGPITRVVRAARLEFCPWLLGMVVVLAQHCVFLRSTDLRRRACSAC